MVDVETVAEDNIDAGVAGCAAVADRLIVG